MGMARKSPRSKSKTTRYLITNHALERVRERITVEAAVDDDDLRFAIDDAIYRGVQVGLVERIVDSDGEDAKLVELDLDASFGTGESFALVKPSYGDREQEESVVTIVSRGIADRFRGREPGPFNPALAAVKDVKPTVPARPPEPKVETKVGVVRVSPAPESEFVAVSRADGSEVRFLSEDGAADLETSEPALWNFYRRVRPRTKVEFV